MLYISRHEVLQKQLEIQTVPTHGNTMQVDGLNIRLHCIPENIFVLALYTQYLPVHPPSSLCNKHPGNCVCHNSLSMLSRSCPFEKGPFATCSNLDGVFKPSSRRMACWAWVSWPNSWFNFSCKRPDGLQPRNFWISHRPLGRRTNTTNWLVIGNCHLARLRVGE